ncbi:hypothetical protein P5V15_008132 [Pogonomyrmex californicus]
MSENTRRGDRGQRASFPQNAKISVASGPEEEGKIEFPALGLPIVPRTHFRTHRTRRWAHQPGRRHRRRRRRSTGLSRGLRRCIQDHRSVIRTFGTSGTSGTSRPSIARSQDTRAGSNIIAFELTELSRIVLLQAIVPESSRSQASCQCVEIHNYIELRYKLC